MLKGSWESSFQSTAVSGYARMLLLTRKPFFDACKGERQYPPCEIQPFPTVLNLSKKTERRLDELLT